MSTQDRRFFELFSIVLGALVLFTIIIFIVARHIASGTQLEWVKEEVASGTAQQERLAPVGKVAIAGEAAPAPAPATEASAAGPGGAGGAATSPLVPQAATASGEDIYNGVCFACHATGVAGAPKLGDKADWGPRIAQGEETLVKHAIEGFQGQKGVMPPKGGRVDLPDDAVKAAVEFMMSKAQ